jgi:O-antigen ligase/Tfp pilus assembly protein PilF
MENKRLSSLFCLGIFFCTLAFSPFVMDFTLTPKFILLAALLFVCTAIIYRQSIALKVQFDVVILALTAYILYCCLTICWSLNKAEAIFESSKLVLSYVVFLLAAKLLQSPQSRTRSQLLKISVLVVIIEFIVACFQLTNAGGLNKESMYLVTGLNGHKNLFSSFLFLNLCFLLMAYCKLSDTWKVVTITGILLNTALIILLRTKAVWVGIAAMLVIAGAIQIFKFKMHLLQKIPAWAVIIVLVIFMNLFFLVIGPRLVKEAIIQETATSEGSYDNRVHLDQERLIIWDKTYQVFEKKKLAGTGMGNWQIYFPDVSLTGLYRAEDLNFTFQRPHNDFLWILSETGLIGFNLFIITVISIIVLLIKKSAAGDPAVLKRELVILIAFITGFLVISCFDFPKERIEHGIWFYILLAMAYVQLKKGLPETLKSFKTISLSPHMALSFLALLAFILITGIYRYKGEYYARKMLACKSENNFQGLISMGKKAMSYVFTIDPTSVPIAWHMGNANAALMNYQEAQHDFFEALHYNPFNRNVLNDLASSLVYTGNSALAKRYYEEAARISPRFDDPKLNLAAVYMAEKNFEMAQKWLDALLHDSEKRTQYQRVIDSHR